MADDPLVKFFREDLTEAEEQALAERLQNSTEDALRFGREAEDRYHAYGLPEPEPLRPLARPIPPAPAHFVWLHGALKGLAALLGLAVASAVGLGLWRAFVPPENGPLMPSVSTSVPSGEPVVLQPVKASAPTSREGGAPAPKSPTPDLSITVHKAQAGPVTVEVLDMEGTPLCSLYQGMLRQGDLTFQWDGKLSDGTKAPAGLYRIRLSSGGMPQEKLIRVP